jgi:predicted DNA-binding protein YlxM (UPF0122 family)
MDIEKINLEISKVQNAPFAKKTDSQLLAYEMLHELYKHQNKGQQPLALAKFNNSVYRKCKLNQELVNQIRSKYVPHVYGKKKLAEEYGVSTSVIYRIIKGQSWKTVLDSS